MVHEAVGLREIAHDFLDRMNLEITVRQAGEVGLDLIRTETARQEAASLCFEQITLHLLRANEIRSACQHGPCFVVELPKQRVLEPVPQFAARRLCVGEAVQGEHVQVFRRLNLAGEVADHPRVIQIALLRHLGHGQVMLDHQAQGMGGRPVQAQTPGRSQGQLPAGQSMFAFVPRLARIVQQQGQIEKERPFDFLKKLGVFVERRVLRLPNPVQLFEAH